MPNLATGLIRLLTVLQTHYIRPVTWRGYARFAKLNVNLPPMVLFANPIPYARFAKIDVKLPPMSIANGIVTNG